VCVYVCVCMCVYVCALARARVRLGICLHADSEDSPGSASGSLDCLWVPMHIKIISLLLCLATNQPFIYILYSRSK
jgi:hypothetical protein